MWDLNPCRLLDLSLKWETQSKKLFFASKHFIFLCLLSKLNMQTGSRLATLVLKAIIHIIRMIINIGCYLCCVSSIFQSAQDVFHLYIDNIALFLQKSKKQCEKMAVPSGFEPKLTGFFIIDSISYTPFSDCIIGNTIFPT